MAVSFDADAANAIFTLPRPDGSFDPDFTAYLNGLGRRRPSVLFAFAPKCAGTFLRTAAIHAVDGQLTRIVHAQGGRDGTPYLPTYILYLAGGVPQATLVAHVHMQAFAANRRFIEALDLKPVIMLRSVPDMLLSYLDMLDGGPVTPEHWLNGYIPPDFSRMDDAAKSDFVVEMLGPWYASYYATWSDYAAEAPERVCVLRYADFKSDPAAVLHTALKHSGLERTPQECREAVDLAWEERTALRFSKGEQGRGTAHFNAAQLARLESLLFRHCHLAPLRDELMPASTPRAAS